MELSVFITRFKFQSVVYVLEKLNATLSKLINIAGSYINSPEVVCLKLKSTL